MRPLNLKFLLTLLMLFLTAQLQAAGARRGWTKVELSHADGRNAPIPAALLTQFGGELIGDYGAYSIVYVPKGIVTALEAQAARENLRVRGRDDLDVLHLPGATVDVREGISGVSADKLTREYPPGRHGVYVLQFIGPLRNEWAAELRELGWHLSRYIPNNAYLVVGKPELIGRTRQLSFVNWLDFYHPYQKPKSLKGDGQSHDLMFELAEGAVSDDAIEAIRAAADGPINVRKNSYDTRVYARMSDAAAEELLRNEVVLSAGVTPVGRFSDERQALSLTSMLNASRTAPLLTARGQYWSWISSVCSECAVMSPSIWKIGVADTGLDNGQTLGGHQDFYQRKFFGSAIYPPWEHDPECGPNVVCDIYSHGTIVAGIAAGRPITGDINGPYKDNGGFLLGQGAAPYAGIFATKIASEDSREFAHDNGINGKNLFLWATDAANAGVTIQNHSWNEYTTPNPGKYSALSRDYDIATRDADGVVNFNRSAMLFSISAGNHEFNDPHGELKYLTLPGATAKNVLSVGGLETWRPDTPVECRFTKGESYKNMMRYGRAGTNISGYVKPDVMAPASLVVSTNTSLLFEDPPGYCFDNIFRKEYTGDSGTSFAAPLGAAASLLVKRYLGSAPSDVSPALTRAVLIAGAQSVRGGLDKRREFTPTGIVPIGPIPSQQQGFGRLTLEDVLTGSQKPIVFDQAAGSRTFTAAGQSWSTTVRVRDASNPVKVALVWSDTPAAADVPYPLINDLNLEVRRTSNPYVVYVGNSMTVGANGEESIAHSSVGGLPYDYRNTVEVARVFLNASEEFTVTVRAWQIAGDTNEAPGFEQDFALAILNADSTCVPAYVAQHPQNQTVTPGSMATVSVVPGGTGPFLYQWYEGETGDESRPKCGGAYQSCTVGPLTVTTKFWVRVRGACGSYVFSNAGTVFVQCTAAPSITAQPASQTINYGGSATLGVAATQAVSYQWYLGASPNTASPIAGATGPYLTVNNLTSTTSYWVRVTNGCGIANSVTATVCVRPLITAHPTSRTINPGQSTTLTVSAANATSYQWYQGTAPSTTTPVGTGPSLTVSPAATTNYWVRVLNSCSSVDSTTATVTVAPPPPPQITRIQSSFALANSQTSITGSWPQPTQAGTLLVAVISGNKDPNGWIAWTPPAGWQHAVTQEWTNIITSIYYLPNNGGARMSERFTVAQGYHDQILYLFEYSGIVAVNPLDRTAVAGNDFNDGYVETGYTPNTVQAKELVITGLTIYAPTEFYNACCGFVELYDKSIIWHLTTAAHQYITTAAGSYGHWAAVGDTSQWVGVVATFKAAN